jgi:nitrogen fixation NifU-like protein
MTSDLRELYQATVLDHYKRPRNFRVLEGTPRTAAGHNPLCGDRVTVYLQVEDGIVKDIGFKGAGCAISTASASLMTESLKGKTVDEVERLFQGFHRLVTGEESTNQGPALGKLEVFSGVREFPVRVKCATLPWHTLRAALAGDEQPVTTE